jgi:hypothetical protein
MQHIVATDLQDPQRLLALHSQARRLGLVNGSAMERLQFFAAAERANRIGRDPCGLFAAIVRRRLYGFISQGEEDAAHKRLKRLAEEVELIAA